MLFNDYEKNDVSQYYEDYYDDDWTEEDEKQLKEDEEAMRGTVRNQMQDMGYYDD